MAKVKAATQTATSLVLLNWWIKSAMLAMFASQVF
jgi:hypothetical protein